MLVYGDSEFTVEPIELIAGLQKRFACPISTLDEARARVVFAGQLEQAAEDQDLDWAEHARRLTDMAASDFTAMRSGLPSGMHFEEERRRLEMIAEQISPCAQSLRVRTPEGFACYGLYPDSYAHACETWARACAAGARVLVLGIRSIGTTLSAIVAATLRHHGIKVARTTVRPHGHPFARQTALASSLPDADIAVIVDEGPGLSGSSFASVAAALAERGYRREAIVFFAGHSHGPGHKASPEGKLWWSQVECQTASWEDTRWSESTALQTLSQRAEDILDEPLACGLIDAGGGRWRNHIATSPGRMHAVAPFLEQPKLLASGRSGRSVLFKFAGFAIAPGPSWCSVETTLERQHARISILAEGGYTPLPLAACSGWLALPWLPGRHLSASDRDAPLATKLGGYINASAGAPMRPTQRAEAHARLQRILGVNASELLGDHGREAANRAIQRLGVRPEEEYRTAGDGRMAPHEWISNGDGLLKLDAGGHDMDHTAAGLQPVWWDIAGACVEWNLGSDLSVAVARAAGEHWNAKTARFYLAAYSAFRAGIAGHACDLVAEDRPKHAYRRALAYYRKRLRSALSI